MDYIRDININEAVIHILDINASEPGLNEYSLELNEDIYKFLYKHIEKCLNSDELKYARFNGQRNIVKEVVKEYLNGEKDNLIQISKEIAKQLFIAMDTNEDVESGDLVVASLTTDQGPLIAILKMDYVKGFTHEVQFIDEKMGIEIVQHTVGLPGSGQRLEKAAFIKPIREDENYNLMILDKQRVLKEDEFGDNYFINTFLNSHIITNERDLTKTFVTATEKWTRKNITDNAEKAEEIRSAVKNKLKEEDCINIDEFSKELFHGNPQIEDDYLNYIRANGIYEEVAIDRSWADKKLKKVKINIDKHIDLNIDEDTFRDCSKFEIIKNGDGTINMIIKNISNYIEK